MLDFLPGEREDPRVSFPFSYARAGARGAAGALCLAAMMVSPAGAEIRHVIHMSIDGLRGDFLRALVQEPGSRYFGFARLQREGAVTYNARCDFSYSITTPNHTGMITGRPVIAEEPLSPEIQHGYTTNYTVPAHILHIDGSPPGYKASTFDRVHDRGLRTALLLSKEKMSLFDRSYGPLHGAPDTDGADNGRDKIDLTRVHEGNTAPLISALLTEMDRDFPAYTFIHLCDPDYAGHSFGWTSQNWKTAVKGSDAQLSVILAALDDRPALKAATAIVITADHGGGSPDNTHLDNTQVINCTIPVIVWGPGIPGGVDAHALFSDRSDPADAIISNTNPDQPLRNSDTGNIAMALLGLPPVEGSFHRPTLDPKLEISQGPQGRYTVRWPSYLTGWKLQWNDTLDAAGWTDAPGPPQPAGVQMVQSEPEAAPPAGKRFFRLAAPQ